MVRAAKLDLVETGGELAGAFRVASETGANPAIDVAYAIVVGVVPAQRFRQRVSLQADGDRQRGAAVAVLEIHRGVVGQQRFENGGIVVQHHRFVQAVAFAAPDAHRPVGIAVVLEQQPREGQVVEAQRMGQGVADVPLRRLGGQQRFEALRVGVPHRGPHRAAFVQRGAVGDVRTGGQQQLRQRGALGAVDGCAERGAAAADGLGFAHGDVHVRAGVDERLGQR